MIVLSSIGHGSDVRSVHWHPQKGLIVSGSRDSQQPVKLWDPKSGQCLATLLVQLWCYGTALTLFIVSVTIIRMV